VGGIDEGAPSVEAAQWDLAIRLAEAHHTWVEVEAVDREVALTIPELANERSVRWVYGRHAQLFGERLQTVLLDREAEIGRLLKRNHLGETGLDIEQRPLVTARRRERDRLAAKLRTSWPEKSAGSEFAAGWGDFRRLEPLSPMWGNERGLPVDRYYIERFLEAHADDIKGSVLEVGDSIYSARYGGDRVAHSDVIDVDTTNEKASIVADLGQITAIEEDTYDCVILTHVLQYIHDAPAALTECRRILKPGGVLLTTVPTATRLGADWQPYRDHWRWTHLGFKDLLEEAFAPFELEVSARGSRATVLAFLAGLAADDLDQERLDQTDPDVPLLLTARAIAS
jgi:SAM-dependent methyltransferase